MKIEHRQTGQQGEFFVEEAGDQQALMTYHMEGSTMVIEHTEVDDELQGRNIGQQLVTTAVEWARSHHHKIIPQCSFAKAVIDKMPELQDVLA